MLLLLTLGLTACGPGQPGEPCSCPEPDKAHGVQQCEGSDCGPCMCLPLLEPSEDPAFTTTFYVDPDVTGGDGSAAAPWASLDWDALDSALEAGPVGVYFSACEADGEGQEVWPGRVDLLREDQGEHRLVLDGGALYNQNDESPRWTEAPPGARATVPGIHSSYENVERSRITLRGFEVTGSRDKGIRFQAGDEVVIEDNLVHDNKGSPSISITYVSRSGLPSSSFVVRNNHVWNQRGECIYIGGAEGQDLDAHEHVLIENNLIHDCWSSWSSQHDGINIKDRILSVELHRNVVFNVDWGIELASPGLVHHNLVWSTARNGFHLTDGWGTGLSGLKLEDNVSLYAGEAGLYLNASNNPTQEVRIQGFTAVGAAEAGIELGTNAESGGSLEASLSQLLLEDNALGLDGWGGVEASVESCVSSGNSATSDRDLMGAECPESTSDLGDPSNPAGEDGVFFTEDDPWLSERGGAQLPGSMR